MLTIIMEEVVHKLCIIEEHLSRIEKRLDMIERTVSSTESSCKNMDEHISFVESVYHRVRAPLSYISYSWRGKSLPVVRDKHLITTK